MRITVAIAAALTILALTALPALGELTDYQKGVADGLKIGLFMGEYKGWAKYSTDAARQFNGFLANFNDFLTGAFGNNQTMLNKFRLAPIPLKSAQTRVIPQPDSEGRIYGYPADAYYSAIGAVPGGSVVNPGDAMGGV